MNDVLGLAKLSTNGLDVFKTIYPDLAQPGIKKVGYALETVLDLANTILLPLKLINEKSKLHFQKHMDVYKEKLDKIPEEKVGTVPPEIGLTIVDELLKVTNEDIAELFINLLVNASNIDNSRNAHPSFINIIKSIIPDEAKIINSLISNPTSLIFIRIVKVESGGVVPLFDVNFTNLNDLTDLVYSDNERFYLNNLVSLGILQSELFYFIHNNHLYEKIEDENSSKVEEARNELVKLGPPYNNGSARIEIERGRYTLTEYGKGFVNSITV